MREELLKLKPKKWLCHCCGKWHDWNLEERLIEIGEKNPIFLVCPEKKFIKTPEEKLCTKLYISEKEINCTITISCKNTIKYCVPKIPISELKEKYNDIGKLECIYKEYLDDSFDCYRCRYKRNCLYNDNSDIIDIGMYKIGFLFDEEDTNFSNIEDVEVKPTITENTEKKNEVKPTITENLERKIEVKPTINKKSEEKNESKLTISKKSEENIESKKEKQHDKKEKKATINNNIFNMKNVGFGLNKDENIASTIMGIAIKKNDSWRIFNKEEKQITDYENTKIGNFPIFIIPTIELKVGDVIKEDEEYYFITKAGDNEIEATSAITGVVRNIIPVKNFLGFEVYAKVMAITDQISLNAEKDMKQLAIILAMLGKNADNGEKQMNQFLPILLLNNKENDIGDMERMLLMISIMNNSIGNEENASNLMMNYFMMSLLMEKKSKKNKKGKKSKKNKKDKKNRNKDEVGVDDFTVDLNEEKMKILIQIHLKS